LFLLTPANIIRPGRVTGLDPLESKKGTDAAAAAAGICSALAALEAMPVFETRSVKLAQEILVIGAGPAGLYASRRLAEAGHRVVLFNRDVRPGGLAEYGIYHDKYKMKRGLRAQFK